jgi:hypothetical protein
MPPQNLPIQDVDSTNRLLNVSVNADSVKAVALGREGGSAKALTEASAAESSFSKDGSPRPSPGGSGDERVYSRSTASPSPEASGDGRGEPSGPAGRGNSAIERDGQSEKCEKCERHEKRERYERRKKSGWRRWSPWRSTVESVRRASKELLQAKRGGGGRSRSGEGFEEFKEKVFEGITRVLYPLYGRACVKYWNDSQFSQMPKVYAYNAYDRGVFAYAVPTFLDCGLKYNAFILKVVEELSPEKFEELMDGVKEEGLRGLEEEGLKRCALDGVSVYIAAPRYARDAPFRLISARTRRSNADGFREFYAPVIGSSDAVVVRVLKWFGGYLASRLDGLLSVLSTKKRLSYWEYARNYFSKWLRGVEYVGLSRRLVEEKAERALRRRVDGSTDGSSPDSSAKTDGFSRPSPEGSGDERTVSVTKIMRTMQVTSAAPTITGSTIIRRLMELGAGDDYDDDYDDCDNCDGYDDCVAGGRPRQLVRQLPDPATNPVTDLVMNSAPNGVATQLRATQLSAASLGGVGGASEVGGAGLASAVPMVPTAVPASRPTSQPASPHPSSKIRGVASSPSVTYICNRGGHGEPSIILGSGGGAGAGEAGAGAADFITASNVRASNGLGRPLGKPSTLYRGAVVPGRVVELLKELRDVCEELVEYVEHVGHGERGERGELRELAVALRSSPLTLLRLLPSSSVMKLLRSLESSSPRPSLEGSGDVKVYSASSASSAPLMPSSSAPSAGSSASRSASAPSTSSPRPAVAGPSDGLCGGSGRAVDNAGADDLVGWELAERSFEQVRWYLSAVKFRIDCLTTLVCEGLSRSMKCLYEVVERILDGLEDFLRGLYARRVARWLVNLPPIRRVLDVMRRCMGSEVLSFKLKKWREVLNSIFEGLRGEVEGLLRREQRLVDEAMTTTFLSYCLNAGGG